MAEEFFISIGFPPLPREFWDRSLLVKPRGRKREVVCHASAWNFKNGSDVRIKMCTEVNIQSFLTIHHEMGHIYSYLDYETQPYIFQTGANPGIQLTISLNKNWRFP